MARSKTPSPLDREGAVEKDGAQGTITVAVRSTGFRRYRAGLGPFTREPVIVSVTRDQLIDLQGDSHLIVEEA